MSKREINAPGWTSAPQSHMATDPSVGRFSNDQTVSLLAKYPSAKFRDNDRTKSLAPFSNHGQHSQQPSQQPLQRPAGTDIVDLRTAPESEWKFPEEWDYLYIQEHVQLFSQQSPDFPVKGDFSRNSLLCGGFLIISFWRGESDGFLLDRQCSWYSLVE